MTWAFDFAVCNCSWKLYSGTIRLTGIFIIDEQSPGTSRNVCGVLSVFIYGHLLNFEATPAWDRQDGARVAFFVESACDLYWIAGINQPADTRHGRAIDLVGAIPGRVLDDVPKLHNDQWVVHASLVIPSFCNEAISVWQRTAKQSVLTR